MFTQPPNHTAFLDRGHHDYYGSHDLEDLMTVVDGRASIVAEIDRMTPPLRDCVITCTQKLLAAPEFRDALPGYLPPEEEGRIGLLRQKLEDIAQLALLG